MNELEKFREWAESHLKSFVEEQLALMEQNPEDYEETNVGDFVVFYVESF